MFRDQVGLECRACGREFEARVWLIVDASERPDLTLEDKLFSPTCPHCGQVEDLDYPLLLYLPDAEPPLLFSPPPGFEQFMVQDQVGQLVESLRKPLGSLWREEWLTEDLPVIRHKLLASAVEQPQAVGSHPGDRGAPTAGERGDGRLRAGRFCAEFLATNKPPRIVGYHLFEDKGV